MNLKKSFIVIAGALCFGNIAFAQNAQSIVAEAAKELMESEKTVKEKKPDYWTKKLVTNFGFTETSLTNWAAGGYNTITLITSLDGTANYKKDDMFWNNHLQMDYGFIYSDDKPFMQKNNDRIYLESKWGYKATKQLNYSANFNFRSQFTNSYTYKNPGVENPSKKDWKNSGTLMSGLLSPAYADIGVGIDWVPNKWLSLNFAPLTGGVTIVRDDELRSKYKMTLKSKYEDETEILGSYYKGYRFELGAKVKTDAKVNINESVNYSSQLVLFSNYLDSPLNMRVNWDNAIDWKIAKYFTVTFKTFLIYDENVLIVNSNDIDKYPNGKQRIQFKEYLTFNFSYTFQPKKK